MSRTPRGRGFGVAAGAAALALAALTAAGRGRDLDRRLYRWANRERGPGADAFFKSITELGSIWASAGAATALAARGRRREGIDALGAAAAMWGLGQVLKRMVDRPRPYLALDAVRLLIDPPRATSWPSSHPAVLLAFLVVVCRDLEAQPRVKAVAVALAMTVGLSRVQLGVHYPADVAGGLLLGWGLADLWSVTVSPRTMELGAA